MTEPGQAIPGRRAEAFDREKEYLPDEAIKILKGFPDAKFDETVEVAVPPRHRPPQGRPDAARHGVAARTAPASRSASACSPWARRRARPRRPAPTSWAARSSSNEVMKGEIDFDAAVATPDMMAVGREGRPGPRAPRA